MMIKRWMFVVMMVSLLLSAGPVVAHEGEDHESHGAVQKVTGEVVDLACYLSEGMTGPGHRDCAKKCIASGLPVGIKSDDQIYLLVTGEHGPANATLTPLAAKNVTVEGTVSERNGIHLLAIKKLTVNE